MGSPCSCPCTERAHRRLTNAPPRPAVIGASGHTPRELNNPIDTGIDRSEAQPKTSFDAERASGNPLNVESRVAARMEIRMKNVVWAVTILAFTNCSVIRQQQHAERRTDLRVHV